MPPRTVLAQANGKVGQQGAIADYLEVEAGYERAVEACLGDLLQHVIVERPEHAAAGFELVREQDAGRCGFLIAPMQRRQRARTAAPLRELNLPGLVDAVVGRPRQRAVRRRHSHGDRRRLDRRLVRAGGRGQPRRGASGRHARRRRVPRSAASSAAASRRRRAAFSRPSAKSGSCARASRRARGAGPARRGNRGLRSDDRAGVERHRGAERRAPPPGESRSSALEAQLQRAAEEAARVAQKRRAADARAPPVRGRARRRSSGGRKKPHASIVRLEHEQRTADERLTAAQRRLFEARESTEDLSRRAAEARAAHAALVERAAGARRRSAAARRGVARSRGARRERSSAELATIAPPHRGSAHGDRRRRSAARRRHPRARDAARGRRERRRRGRVAAHQGGRVRSRRSASRAASLESLRAAVAELDIVRATAESDLAHLASSCFASRAGDARRRAGRSRGARRDRQHDARRRAHLRRRAARTPARTPVDAGTLGSALNVAEQSAR